jgi:hypothetical protein
MLLAASLVPAATSHNTARPPAVAIIVDGRFAPQVRAKLATSMPAPILVVDKDTFEAALAERGFTGAQRSRTERAPKREDVVAILADAARALGVTWVVYLRRLPTGPGAWLLVVEAQAGEVLVDREVSAAGLLASGRRSASNRQGERGPNVSEITETLAPVFSQPEPPPTAPAVAADPAEPAPPTAIEPRTTVAESVERVTQTAAVPPSTAADGAATSKAGTLWSDPTRVAARKRKTDGVERAAVVLTPALGTASRKLAYSGQPVAAGAPHVTGTVLKGSVDLELYPAAWLETGLLDGLGVHAGLSRAFGLESAPRGHNDLSFPTTWTEIDTDVRFRLATERFTLVTSLGYGIHKFRIAVDEDQPIAEQTPALTLGYLRAAVDAKVRVAAVKVLAGGGYRHVIRVGRPFQRGFPQERMLGFDVSAGLAYLVTSYVEISAIATRTQYQDRLEPATAAHAVRVAILGDWGLRLRASVLF